MSAEWQARAVAKCRCGGYTWEPGDGTLPLCKMCQKHDADESPVLHMRKLDSHGIISVTISSNAPETRIDDNDIYVHCPQSFKQGFGA